ncbi:MAG: peptidylprolyl isomerase [Patescibacteria group bacterium]
MLHTSFGDIEVELFDQSAPRTVQNFIELSKRGYYNNLTWHRVIRDFVIQGGDPKGDGGGGESAWGGQFEDEINPQSIGVPPEQIKQYESQGYRYNSNLQSKKMEPGVLAMANSGPNTNGSQFFIVTEQAQPYLDGKHTVFGRVTKGMEIVRLIASVEVDENDKPKEPVSIQGIEIK